MNVLWSPHAETLLADIVLGIAEALSIDDGLRWEGKLRDSADQLANFPELGTNIPESCYNVVPENANRLKQLVCNPYRIVYEQVENEIHVLSIRHSRMLVAEGDTGWN